MLGLSSNNYGLDLELNDNEKIYVFPLLVIPKTLLEGCWVGQ